MIRYYLHRKQVQTVELGGGKRTAPRQTGNDAAACSCERRNADPEGTCRDGAVKEMKWTAIMDLIWETPRAPSPI